MVMGHKICLPIFLMFSLLGCATREEIQRRELLSQLADQMQTTQRINSDSIVRLAEIEERIGLVSGKIEETAHSTGQTYQMRLTAMEQKNKTVEEQSQHVLVRLEQMEKTINAQQKYLEEVLSTLAKLGGKKSSAKSSPPASPFDQAMTNYRSGKYDLAFKQLSALIDDKSIKGNRRARVFHNLAMIQYSRKKYDESLTYFSKMLTDFPKSPYNANGLLFLGKAFHDKGNKTEAVQAWNELIKQYPKHKHAATAKKLIKGQ